MGHSAAKLRIKFNGRGAGTYIEQLLLDLGAGGTKFLCNATLKQGMRYLRHFGDADLEMVKKAMKECNIPMESFLRERDPDELTSSDTIQFTTPKNLEIWKEQHKKGDFSRPICMVTPAQQHPKCINCGYCPTPEEKRQMVARSIENENTVDDVINSLSDARHVDTTTFVIKKKAQWDFVSLDMLSHKVTADFLACDDNLADNFYAVGPHTALWSGSNGQKGWFSGTQAFQVFWKKRMQKEEIAQYIDKVNFQLESCQVVDVHVDQKENKITTQSQISYVCYISDVSMSRLRDRMAVFEWDIKMAEKAMGGDLSMVKVSMPELKDQILFEQLKDKLVCTMILPAKLNPYLVLSSILNVGVDKVVESTQVVVLDHTKEIPANCHCGHHLSYSYIKNDITKECPICTTRKILYTLTHRK